ncbi:MAG: hypothetical protein DRI90_25265 [Deltaproteobacteria bacterium]|nr:MAG: hypothetical protein DRI90_25265 [Deltaproteobacteria bacterium]
MSRTDRRTAGPRTRLPQSVEPSRSHRLRYVLAAFALAMLAATSCAPDFDPPSKLDTLRILAVTIDTPYALAGDDVTLRMTVFDGAGHPDDPDSVPRNLQIIWLGGCFDPEGDLYYLCFTELAELMGSFDGGMPPEDLVKFDAAPGSLSGTPDAHEFTFTMPNDIVSRRPKPPVGPHYGIAYVFFAACAGQIVPVELTSPGGGQVPDFPLECHDIAGNKLGSESFVIGYTQVYAFADERANANPPIEAITLDGIELPDDPADAPVVESCPVTEDDRRAAACASDQPVDDCRQYVINATIGDVAEVDPGAVDIDGNPMREVVWVSYFAKGGDMSMALSLVSDATEGYLNDHDTDWVPPAEPGTYAIWAVARDQRGGSSVVRRYVRVE